MDQSEHESEVRGLPLDIAIDDIADQKAAVVAAATGIAILGALAAIGFVAGSDAPWWLYGALAVGAVGVLYLTYRLTRTWAGWGNPSLHLPSSEPLHLGDQLTVRFRRVARRGTDLTNLSVSAKVIAEETAGAGSRDAQAVTVHEATAQVRMFSVVDQTVEVDLAVEIPLSSIPPTTKVGSYEVSWRLLVEVEAPNAPDDVSEFVLIVDPKVATRLQSGGKGR